MILSMLGGWKKQITPVSSFGKGSANPFHYDPYADVPGLEISGAWDDRMLGYLKKQEPRGLSLSAYNGFSCESFKFLSELGFLEHLTIPLHGNAGEHIPLEILTELKSLSSTLDPLPAPIDFAKLTKLRSCSVRWHKNASSLADCTNLERLRLSSLKRDAVPLLENLTRLRHLGLSHSGIDFLGPLSKMEKMEFLELEVVRQLQSLEGIEAFPNLKCLYLNEAHKVHDLTPVSGLKNLEALIIVDCGEIDSLAPLAETQRLKAVSFAGSKTTIKDGDLSPLTQLPNLSMLMFGARRHYSHKLVKTWNWENFNNPDELLEPKS